MTNTEMKYKGKFTVELEKYAIKRINELHKSHGYRLRDAITMFSEEVGVPNTTMNAKWYGVGGYNYALRKMTIEDIDCMNEDVTDFDKTNNAEIKQPKKQHNRINNGTLELLLNEIKSLTESNQKMHKDMGKLWKGFEELKETNQTLQEMLVTDIGDIRAELDNFKIDVQEQYKEKLDRMEKIIRVKNEKLKEKEMEVQKVKSTYANLVFNSKVNNTILTDRKNTQFKMDVNGNLTKVN